MLTVESVEVMEILRVSTVEGVEVMEILRVSTVEGVEVMEIPEGVDRWRS